MKKFFLSLLHDTIASSCGDEITHSSALVDNAIARELLVCLYCGICVYLQQSAVFSYAWDSIVVVILSGKNLVTESVAYLEIYWFVLCEYIHSSNWFFKVGSINYLPLFFFLITDFSEFTDSFIGCATFQNVFVKLNEQ